MQTQAFPPEFRQLRCPMLRVTDTITVANRELTERFVRAWGSGGWNKRCEATAAELRFDIGASSLPVDVKARLITLGGRHVIAGGVLLIVSRSHVSQADNRTAARRRWLDLVRRAAAPRRARTPTRLSRQVRESRLRVKRLKAAVKRARHVTVSDDDVRQ